MKAFISALALFATHAAADNQYGMPTGGYGGHTNAGFFGLGGYPVDYRDGKPDPMNSAIKIIGATKYTSESVIGGSNFNSKSAEIMPDYYDSTSFYDDYAHGKDGWKAVNRGVGDAGAHGKARAAEEAFGHEGYGAWADANGHADAGAKGSAYQTDGSDEHASGKAGWAA